MQRTSYTTGTPWERTVGYSRAVRVGPHVFVSGTTATNERGEVVGGDDVAMQTRQILRNIDAALTAVGACLEDVVRTRMFVRNIDDWEVIGRIHGEVFASIKPVATMVEVSRLIEPAILLEIEVDALVLAYESD